MSIDRREALDELSRTVQRNTQETVRFYGAVADRLGMHVTDLHCLGLLYDLGPSAAGELARQLTLTTGAITRVVDRLVERGYVRRTADPRDRRRVVVEVVYDNTAEVSAQFAGMGAHLETSVAGFSDEQIRFLLDFFRHRTEVSRAQTERLRGELKTRSKTQ